MTPTFGLIADPMIDIISCCSGVAEVQAPALTLEVCFIGGHKGLLHWETVVAEHGVSNLHKVLV